jgi:hypothetical protein
LLHEHAEHGGRANREDDGGATRDEEGPHCLLLIRFPAASASEGPETALMAFCGDQTGSDLTSEDPA